LTHSTSSQTACPTNAEVGLAKLKPAAAAALEMREFSRSAVASRRASSVGENQVRALQSSPLKIRG
jgi:hypothetical protein